MAPDLVLTPAAGALLTWCKEQVRRHHYLHTAPDPRTRPFAYAVLLQGEPVGCLHFGRPEATCCYRGGLTYGSQAGITSGRAAFDRWEVLNLSRVWLSPDVQAGGRLARPEVMPAGLPGHTDRKGVYWPYLASWLIRLSLARVGRDYLLARPPCFVEEPYQVRAVLSYCDTRLHRGTIYKAAGFRRARVNRAGVETWWTPDVAPLTADEDLQVTDLAAVHPRSVRIRNERRSLFHAPEAAPS